MSGKAPARSAVSTAEASACSILRVDRGAGRWEAIPTRLINDERLGLDTRGFAAWLLARPDGWQIRPSALPKLLSSEAESVGRDKTRRFLRELEAARYLTRSRWRLANGRWVWQFRFQPDPIAVESSNATIDGLAGGGSAVDGSTVAGKPVDLHQTLISSRSDHFLNGTTTTEAPAAGDSGTVPDRSSIQYPRWFEGEKLSAAKQLIVRCPPADAQAVIDELGAMMAQGVVRHPMGLLRALVTKAAKGEFVPNRSLDRNVDNRTPGNKTRAKSKQGLRLVSDVAQRVISDLHSKFSEDPS